jgi:MoxR-like ATPase
MVDRTNPDYFYVDEKLKKYLNSILEATRALGEHGLSKLEELMESGAPAEDFARIMGVAKEHAIREGRKYMLPQDIRSAAEDTLSLTLILSDRAEARGLDAESVVREILDMIEVP